jgi:sensor domain CHASE-containing protein
VVERSEDSGVTYTEIRNSPVTASASQIATLDDYEVPLDTTVTYRAKARAEI